MISRLEIAALLRDRGLKKTDIRIEVLELFFKCNYALSVRDVVEKVKVKKDRVTIHRALVSFEERGLLHRASEDGQGAKFALNQLNDNKLGHKKHVHFVCDKCDKTYCLINLSVPDVDIPNEYIVNRAYYSVNGICKKCRP